ncbi:MAG TPA: hypothetical protein VJZ98_07795 [Actinomycetota bacterium]|nr:hypothetical protein [Actinomycetota bacterium]
MSTHRLANAMKNAPKIVTPITDGKSLRKIEVTGTAARGYFWQRPRRPRNPARSLRFPALDGVG